jgi:hypothetical protein
LLAFTDVYFFETGLFNELRPSGIKNSAPSQARRRMAQADPFSISTMAPRARGFSPRSKKNHSTISDFYQHNVEKI